MASKTLTSANSVFTISIPGVYPTPQTLQGYATDDAFGTEAVDAVQAVMGVDGRKSSGYTPYMTKTMIHLQADSPSIDIFEGWLAAMDSAREDFPANASIDLPGQQKQYTLTKGSLTRPQKFGDIKKIAQPLTYEITWESVQPSASL